jgi:putative endonuclease
MWLVYILRCADGTLYTGVTNDMEKRLVEHNAGRGARYTRTRRPVEVVYREEAPDRGAAQRRESEIKRMPAAAKQRMAEAGPAPGRA